VSGVAEVRSGECTLCLECTRVCERAQALTLSPARLDWRLPGWALVLPLGLALAAGLLTAEWVAFASFQRTYSSAPVQSPATAVFTVDGVRCVDTAQMAAAQLDEVEGVLTLTAHASDRLLRITYDSAVTGPEAILQALEGPVFEEKSGAFLFNVFHVLEIAVEPAE
jgi:polyferredoxin